MTRSPARLHDVAGERRVRRGRAASAPGAPAPAATALGRDLVAGFLELGDKLVAYYLVRIRAQGRAARGRRELASLVAETCRRDPKRTAFLLERLCYDFVRGRWRAGEKPWRLLCGEGAAALPERSLILLHAGLGMALAEILFGDLRPDSPREAFAAALERFTGLVMANARPEYAAVSYEALGLIVRRFLPRLHGAVEARLRAGDPRLAAYYWHGAGRAIYFLPGYFHPFPGTVRRGLEVCRREAPDASYRLDAIAGLSFASTMINLRRPELVARLLPHLEPAETAAMASGVGGALLTRHHTTPEEPAVRAFLRPLAWPDRAATDGGLAELWEGAVRAPCLLALDRAYPLLRARGELATLACHRPLGALLPTERQE